MILEYWSATNVNFYALRVRTYKITAVMVKPFINA